MKHLKGYLNKTLICIVSLLLVSSALMGCIDSQGPDAISSRGDAATDITGQTGYACIDCHLAGKSEQFNKRRTKTRTHKGITNRIKGLDKIRGKVK